MRQTNFEISIETKQSALNSLRSQFFNEAVNKNFLFLQLLSGFTYFENRSQGKAPYKWNTIVTYF